MALYERNGIWYCDVTVNNRRVRRSTGESNQKKALATAIALAATLGWGVLLTIPLILVYQGGLALGASLFVGLLTDLQLREMSAVGGLLIMGVGLKLLAIRDVKVADFLPAIIVSPFIVAAIGKVLEALGK